MEQTNSRGYVKKTLDYLVRNAYQKVLPVVLASSMLFTGVGCPGKKGGSDTTSGSSGAPANNAPVIESVADDANFYDRVSPNYGKESTNIVFEAIGKDEDDDSIDFSVTVKDQNGTETTYPMPLDSSNPLTSTNRTGKIFTSGNINLSPGLKKFKFTASDGKDSTSTPYDITELPILNDTDFDAYQTRRSFGQIYMNRDESRDFLSWVANSSNANINRKRLIDVLYAADEQLPDGTILLGGSKVMTPEAHELATKVRFNEDIDGILNNNEIVTDLDGGKLDKSSSPPLFYINLQNGAGSTYHAWKLNDNPKLETLKTIFDISITRSITKNYP